MAVTQITANHFMGSWKLGPELWLGSEELLLLSRV